MRRLIAICLLLVCGAAVADQYRVKIPALGVDTVVEVEKVEAPKPEPEPKPEPKPDPQPKPDPLPRPTPSTEGVELLVPGQKAVLQKLWRDKHPWALLAQGMADYAPNPAWGDYGQWATLVWLATDDAAYAHKAVDRILATFAEHPYSRNDSREYLTTYAMHYRWLRSAMTDAEATEIRRRLFNWAEHCLKPTGSGEGTRLNDSDEVVGHYFGIRAVAKATSGEDPVRAAALLANPQMDEMRKQLGRFCELAKGGEWIESTEYNLGTLQLLLIGAYYDGINKCPEVEALAKDVATQQKWIFTPDKESIAQWGDISKPHDPSRISLVALNSLLAGLVKTGESRSLVAELTKGRTPYDYWHVLYRAMWCFDPTLPAEPYVAPKGFRAVNIGLGIHRDENHLCQILAPISLGVDHETAMFPDVRLWLNGEWVIDHPLGYMPTATAFNTALMAGLSRPEKIEHVSSESTDYGCRVVARQSGPVTSWIGSYPRPKSLGEWTRTTDFHAADHRIEVTDRFEGEPPTNLDAYYPEHRAVIESRLALWQVIYHCPIEPKEIEGGFEWQTQGGQTVRITGNAKAVNLKTSTTPPGGYYHEGQLDGWQIRFLSDEPQAEIKTTITFRQGVN